jgi:hypothetical protein
LLSLDASAAHTGNLPANKPPLRFVANVLQRHLALCREEPSLSLSRRLAAGNTAPNTGGPSRRKSNYGIDAAVSPRKRLLSDGHRPHQQRVMQAAVRFGEAFVITPTMSITHSPGLCPRDRTRNRYQHTHTFGRRGR